MCLDRLDGARMRPNILGDNKLAEKTGSAPEILMIKLGRLTSVDLAFDVTITGFEMAEIDVLLSDAESCS